ncbi:MAG: hypothetical protein ACXIUP_12110, partial [Microcella sp.]
MAFWRRASHPDGELPKTDRGAAKLDDYDYELVPKKRDLTMRLAASDPHQELLTELFSVYEADEDALVTATPARTIDLERVDAPIEVRLFSGRGVTGVVGRVPRTFEGVYDDAIRRLDDRGDKPRIPVAIVRTRA